MWTAIEADLARTGIALADLPRKLSWRAVFAMVRHSRPEDARYLALVELTENNKRDQMAHDVRATIAAAKARGWG